jgi:hypothetical protein
MELGPLAAEVDAELQRLHLGTDLPGGLKRLTDAARRVATPAR